MKKLLLALVLLGLVCSPVMAQNSCDDICNNKCKGQSTSFTACYDSCKRTCVPQKTKSSAKDKQNICENRCAGQGASFQTCYDSCIKH